MKDKAKICCSPVAWGPSNIDGSVIRRCRRCRQAIHVSPSTLNDILKEYRFAYLYCIPCFVKEAKPDDKLEIHESQLLEIETNLRKRKN